MLTRFIQRLAARLAARLAGTAAPVSDASAADHAQAPVTSRLVVKPGDLIAMHDAQQGWRAVKILEVDPWPDGSATAHCLSYEPMAAPPTVESLAHADVLIWHAPIDAGSFGQGWTVIGNQPPVEDERIGFFEYLKLTDFSRYLEATGQDAQAVIHEANAHYQRANELCAQGLKLEGIAAYSAAVNLFPPFFEAIDNRAFTHMELGNFRDALGDFEESLRVNPDGVAAFFSKGECLMRLGELEAAEAVFAEGLTRFPEKNSLFSDFLKQARGRQASAKNKKA